MAGTITINKQTVGPGFPVYIIAELSANHNQDFDEARRLVHAAKEAGADAVKLQTYTPDTLTINCDNEYFRIGKGTIWEGKNLYSLYSEAYTPWDWQPELKQIANNRGMDLFSTPFDPSSVDFLETMDVPAYKIASFEIADIPLIHKIAMTGKPIILSTGMATLSEIDEAVQTIRDAGNDQIALLKCTSAYPARPDEMDLRTIPHLAEAFDVPAGLSDHTLGDAVSIASVALGACIIEKHFTLTRSRPGPDSAFSLEPQEFKTMVESVRETEAALGKVNYHIKEHEKATRVLRKSLFVVKDMEEGEFFSPENIRTIRPSYGLPPKFLSTVLGRKARQKLVRGTPLRWDHIA